MVGHRDAAWRVRRSASHGASGGRFRVREQPVQREPDDQSVPADVLGDPGRSGRHSNRSATAERSRRYRAVRGAARLHPWPTERRPPCGPPDWTRGRSLPAGPERRAVLERLRCLLSSGAGARQGALGEPAAGRYHVDVGRAAAGTGRESDAGAERRLRRRQPHVFSADAGFSRCRSEPGEERHPAGDRALLPEASVVPEHRLPVVAEGRELDDASVAVRAGVLRHVGHVRGVDSVCVTRQAPRSVGHGCGRPGTGVAPGRTGGSTR